MLNLIRYFMYGDKVPANRAHIVEEVDEEMEAIIALERSVRERIKDISSSISFSEVREYKINRTKEQLEEKLNHIEIEDRIKEMEVLTALDEISEVLDRIRSDIAKQKEKLDQLEYDLSNIAIQRINTLKKIEKYRSQREMEMSLLSPQERDGENV